MSISSATPASFIPARKLKPLSDQTITPTHHPASKDSLTFSGLAELLPQMVNSYALADSADKKIEACNAEITRLQEQLRQSQAQVKQYQMLLTQQSRPVNPFGGLVGGLVYPSPFPYQ